MNKEESQEEVEAVALQVGEPSSHGSEANLAMGSAIAECLDPDWPGFKFGLDLNIPNPANPLVEFDPFGDDDVSSTNIVVAFWLEPDDLKAWAVHCMCACPDLVERFPWKMAEVAQFLPSLAIEGPSSGRGPMTLGECQALACLMWAMHPMYEAYDDASKAMEGEARSYQPGHVMQMPKSAAHGDSDPGSEGYIRAVFTFAAKLDQDPKMIASAMRSWVSMRDALLGSGSLDASRWLVEQRTRGGCFPEWSRFALWDIEAIDDMREAWSRLDVSRSAVVVRVSGGIPRL